MSAHRCQLCDRMLLTGATVEGLRICEKCTDVREQVIGIASMYVEAQAFLTPVKSGSGIRSTERTIGVNANALSYREGSDVLGMLTTWYDFLAQKRDTSLEALQGGVGERVTLACQTILIHLGYLLRNELAGDFKVEIAKAYNEGLQVTQRAIPKATKIKCPSAVLEQNNEGEPYMRECGNLLTLPESVFQPFECGRCGSEWTNVRLEEVALASDKDVWLDAEAIGRREKITADAVAKYVHRFNRDNPDDAIPTQGSKQFRRYEFKAYRRARHAEREDI